MSELIKLISVAKTYGGIGKVVTALQDINLSVRESEFLSIIGPSGAGKSTLLHIMGGLDQPTEGTVLFEKKALFDLNEGTMAKWRNVSVGFVFQFYHLIDELTVAENVALPAFLAGAGTKTSLKKAQKLLEYLGILDRADGVPSQLSGGQRQKVAIARALVNEPRVVFCDEPTGNLDTDSAHKVLSLLESLHKEKRKTIVLVTHNPELAKNANRVVYLKEGRIA